MRPTVEEQLLGTCRVLEKVVLPCVDDPYARTMLEGLIANLRMLTSALPAVPGFLLGDNRATSALLARLQPVVDPAVASSIGAALGRPEPDPTDVDALDQRNTELRGLLSQALGATVLPPPLGAAVLEHMTARAARAPMRYVSTAATPAKAT